MKDYLRHLPPALIDDIVSGRCLPIIGSGFSLNCESVTGAKPLTWFPLARAIAAELNSDYDLSDPIDALSAYERFASRSRLIERINHFLAPNEIKPGAVHRSFCKLPFDVVLTTNWDTLLEDGYLAVNGGARRFKAIAREEHLSLIGGKHADGSPSSMSLIKIHGDVNNPDKMVITEEDFDSYISKNPLMSTFLANQLIHKTILFIGYSINDPDFRQIWQIIKDRLGKLTRPAYLLTIQPLSQDRERFCRRGVKPVELPGEKSDTSNILTDLFNELHGYWTRKMRLRDSRPICLMAATEPERVGYFQKWVVPAAQKVHFHAMFVPDISDLRENGTSTIRTLLADASALVVDEGSGNFVMDLAEKMGQEMLLLCEEGAIFRQPRRSLLLFSHPDEVEAAKDFDEVEFSKQLDSWFLRQYQKHRPNAWNTVSDLLHEANGQAALREAERLLSRDLRRVFASTVLERHARYSVFTLTKRAMSKGIIDEAECDRVLGFCRRIFSDSIEELSRSEVARAIEMFQSLSDRIQEPLLSEEQNISEEPFDPDLMRRIPTDVPLDFQEVYRKFRDAILKADRQGTAALCANNE